MHVDWDVSDPESGLATTIGCDAAMLTAETQGDVLTCTAVNNAGLSNTISATIKLDKSAPSISIASPQPQVYTHTATFNVTWSANDGISGIASDAGTLDGNAVTNGQVIDLFFQSLGKHTVVVTAPNRAGLAASTPVTFTIVADIDSLIAAEKRACQLGWISPKSVCQLLETELHRVKADIQQGRFVPAKIRLNAFMRQLDALKGRGMNQQAYDLLKADTLYVISTLP